MNSNEDKSQTLQTFDKPQSLDHHEKSIGSTFYEKIHDLKENMFGGWGENSSNWSERNNNMINNPGTGKGTNVPYHNKHLYNTKPETEKTQGEKEEEIVRRNVRKRTAQKHPELFKQDWPSPSLVEQVALWP